MENAVSLVLCVLFLASVCTNDAMKLVKQTTMTVEEDDVSTDLAALVRLLDVTNGAQDDVQWLQQLNDAVGGSNVQGCSKGKCVVCKEKLGIKLCVEAVLLKMGFSINVKINGKSVYHKEITIANPPPLCVPKIPGLDKLSDLCIQLKNVDLQKRSACLHASFSVKLGPTKKKVDLDLGCFTIPSADDVTADVTDVSLLTTGNQQSAQEVDLVSGDSHLSEEELGSLLEELLSATADELQIDLQGVIKECGHGKCKFCTPGHFLKLCVEGSLLPKGVGFELTVTVGDKTIYHKEISIANPPPICFNHIPVYKNVLDVCIELYEVSLLNKSACVRVSFKVLAKKINLKLGCFKIPVAGDLDTGADGNVVVFQQ